MSETEVTTEVQFESTDDLDTFSTDFFGEKKVDSQAAKHVEVGQDDDSEPSEVTEAQTESEDGDNLEAEIPEEQPKKKKTFQDRIDELVRQREDEKRTADARIEKLQKDFEDKLAALNPQKKSDAPSPTDLAEDGTDKYPAGEFDPAYIRDLTRYEINDARIQAKVREDEDRQKQEQSRAEQALTSSWNEKVEPAKERYPDFQEKGQELVNKFGNLEPSYAQYLTNLLMSMDQGPDVLYYLSSNPDEAVSIVNSGAQKATLALGRIEAKFIEAEQVKKAAKPKVTKAPPPPPVQARGTGGGSHTIEPDTDDLDAFTAAFYRKK